jgi:hypothetical protein
MKSTTASDLTDRLALLPSAFVTTGGPARPVERLIGLQSALGKLPDLVMAVFALRWRARPRRTQRLRHQPC